MTKDIEDSQSIDAEFELKLEWPFLLPTDDSGRLCVIDESHVLGAFSPRDSYSETCLIFNLDRGATTEERLHQPEWVEQSWVRWHRGPERGIRDLSVAAQKANAFAAVVTNANYATCWALGSGGGFTIEAQYGVRSAAVHPTTDLIAIGTGSKVLDTASQAIAEIQLWDITRREIIDSCRLPGSCVISMLWLQDENGLIEGYEACLNDGKALGLNGPCLILEPGHYKTLIAVTTETRNQKSGYVCLVDPQLLTIVAIAEVPERRYLLGIAFNPPRALWAGGRRSLDDFYDASYSYDEDIWKHARCQTSSSMLSRLWIDSSKFLQLGWTKTNKRVVQVWEKQA